MLYPLEINAEELRMLRLSKKVTLRMVEDATGISNAYLSQLETGKIKSPSYRTVAILMNFLHYGVRVDEI